ncbi:hypothetical protein DSM104299_04642 [Baekduia alba]|uniref:hypothetical protein n=1 Tax=Baekduia alba TaxID=2997333 RepID=UPI002341EABC|nr:hypothetical protein [Baekduia alba]WCB95891.1 hypothetical protein DSM104299_04642 [Baekduia alba]
MDSVSAATAASTTSSSTSSSSKATSKTDDGKSFATLFAAAKQDLKKGETLSKVDGHEFGRIKGGTRDDMCVNLSGNARSGQAFDLIWRDGRQFHVYGGKGADHKVVEVGHKAADTTSSSTDSSAATGTRGTGTTGADTTSASGGTSATTTDATSGTGTTGTDATPTTDTSASAKTSS